MSQAATSEGKVILLGEHAVVYGYPALVTAIPDGASAVAGPADVSTLALAGNTHTSGIGELGLALQALLATLEAPPVHVEAELHLPPGFGLGASAALGVAIARAVLGQVMQEAPTSASNQRRVVRAANAWEALFHGTPSGIDVAAAAHGGCFRFTRGQAITPIVVAKRLSLAVAVVGPEVSTKEMVLGLARRRERSPAQIDGLLSEVGVAVEQGYRAIVDGDLDKLGACMTQNQELLATLGLSTTALQTACTLACDAGALGSKLTGKGGGGCVVALCHDAPEPVLAAWRAQGLSCWSFRVPATSSRSSGD